MVRRCWSVVFLQVGANSAGLAAILVSRTNLAAGLLSLIVASANTSAALEAESCSSHNVASKTCCSLAWSHGSMTAATATAAAGLLADLLQHVNGPSAAKVVLQLPQLLPALQALLHTPSTQTAGVALLQQLAKVPGFYGTAAKSHTAGELVGLLVSAIIGADQIHCSTQRRDTCAKSPGKGGGNSTGSNITARQAARGNWQLLLQVLVDLLHEDAALAAAKGSISSAGLVPAVLGLLAWSLELEHNGEEPKKPAAAVLAANMKQSNAATPAIALRLDEAAGGTSSTGGVGQPWQGSQPTGRGGVLCCLQLLDVLSASSQAACDALHDLIVTNPGLLVPWVKLQQQLLAVSAEGTPAEQQNGADIKDGEWGGRVHQALMGCVCSITAYFSTLPVWPPPEALASSDTSPGAGSQEAATALLVGASPSMQASAHVAEDQVPPLKEQSSTWSTSSIFGRRMTKTSHAPAENQSIVLKTKGKHNMVTEPRP